MIQVPYCDVCKIPLTLKEKNGEKFFGCSNWQSCKTKTKPYYGVDKEPQPAPQPVKPPLPAEYGGEQHQQAGEIIIGEMLKDIYRVLEEIRDNLKK